MFEKGDYRRYFGIVFSGNHDILGRQNRKIVWRMSIMTEYIEKFNLLIFILLTTLYLYQLVYIGAVLLGNRKKRRENARVSKHSRFGVIIAARNESLVIGNLIESIQNQSYPSELVDIFVVADNCTDQTAEVARKSGAIVYERFNQYLVGKGYALDYVFGKIARQFGDSYYDAYLIFDADNLLDRNYIAEMNKVYNSGYNIITSYRNSKNYGTNWITAGYSLWFLREAKYLNQARMMFRTNCAVSGTGFLLSSSIVRKYGGWKFHLLTEDIEFSIVNAIEGEKIGYCEKAVIYDEQPCTFSQSWNQRLRWSKGFYQVVWKYGRELISGAFKGRDFSCYDMLMTIAPGTLVSLGCLGVNAIFLMMALLNASTLYHVAPVALKAILFSFVNFYVLLFAIGMLTTITEWKQIKCEGYKKILYVFTFPVFIFTYIPISVVALFKEVKWTPITHSIVKSAEDMR